MYAFAQASPFGGRTLEHGPTVLRTARSTWPMILLIVVLSGCTAPGKPTPVELERGVVWVFPGVGNGPSAMNRAVKGFRDASVDAAVEVYDWDRPFGLISNLVSHDRNRSEAVEVAARVAEYRAAHPDAPIDFVGYSGGGGMAVMVAEALLDDVMIRTIVLAQPALSPDYDLSAALKHVTRTLINCYSDYDWVVLGLGTGIMGTMDRKHGRSAGWKGFIPEQAVPDIRLRERFVQRAWTMEMIRDGHWGGHAYILT